MAIFAFLELKKEDQIQNDAICQMRTQVVMYTDRIVRFFESDRIHSDILTPFNSPYHPKWM